MPASSRATRGDRTPRVVLGVLLTFIALNAFGGAWYGLAGAPGVPTEWLAGSPFSSYRVPSLVLGACVGGSALLAALSVLLRRDAATRLAILAGLVLLAWITAQVAFIGFVSWLQPAMAVAAVVVLALAAWTAGAPGTPARAREA